MRFHQMDKIISPLYVILIVQLFHIDGVYGQKELSIPCSDYKPGEDDLQTIDFIRRFKVDLLETRYPGVVRVRGSNRLQTAYRLEKEADFSLLTSEFFPAGIPEEFSFICTIKIRKMQRSHWQIIRITNMKDDPQFMVTLNSVNQQLQISLLNENGSLNTLSFPASQIFDKKWHKLQFSVFKHHIILYIDCNRTDVLYMESRGRIDIDGRISISKYAESDVTVPIDLQWMVLYCDPTRPERESCEEIQDLPRTPGHLPAVDIPEISIGPPGPTGAPGMKGDKGDRGDHGERGVPGRDGAPGIPGKEGFPGPEGMEGEIGAEGPPGPKGERGDKGERGLEGPRGHPGNPGPMGLTGPPGIPGLQGRPGPPGPSGNKYLPSDRQRAQSIFLKNYIPPRESGPRGLPGPRGAPGEAGPPGERGVDGSAGTPGIPGQDGAPGPAGSPGPKGQKGMMGAQGLPGRGVSDAEIRHICLNIIKDQLQELSILTQGHIKPIYKIRQGRPGPPGQPGHPGEPGTPGERGSVGLPGILGPVGPQGPPGERGEKGEKGSDGIGYEGPAGTPGPPGTPGNDGYGPPGPPGQRGEPGIPGFPGNTGAPGPQGPPGYCDYSQHPPAADYTNYRQSYEKGPTTFL